MGQATSPTIKDIILTAVDRLVARNADGGIAPTASHIVLLGEHAGQNLNAVNHVYVIGSDSVKGGLIAAQEGTTVLGANNLTALANATPALNDGPIVAIGFNIAPLVANRMGADVLIGGEIARNAPVSASPFDSSIVIGYAAMERQRTLNASGGTFARRSVVMGWRAARGQAFTVDGAGTSIADSIVIGSEAMEDSGFDLAAPGTQVNGTIAIGRRALRTVANNNALSSSFDIAIGYQCATAYHSGQSNVFIGNDIATAATDCANDVLIGGAIAGNHLSNNGQNVALGAGIVMTGLASRNIMLGSGASNGDLPVGASDQFLVETIDLTSGLRRNLLYGNMGTATVGVITKCGIAVGLSSAANRDLPGMNILKIINGGRDAALTAPVGGGYFYVAAGALHWVGSANTDTVIAPA